MTFSQCKNAVLSVTLGAVVATTAYVLSTASYVGTSTSVILAPQTSDAGTRWLAETDDISIEVRYISSLTEKPAITIRKKQQWTKLAICMASGILIAYISYVILMRKERIATTDSLPEPTPSEPEKIPLKPSTFPEPIRHDSL
jgi:predicted membrane channel-forming protein YqfA (hemolysin III family)